LPEVVNIAGAKNRLHKKLNRKRLEQEMVTRALKILANLLEI
jgi:hypothetical protein